jgi:hypothetical protein
MFNVMHLTGAEYEYSHLVLITTRPGNSYLGVSAVDLLIKMGCFIKKIILVGIWTS